MSIYEYLILNFVFRSSSKARKRVGCESCASRFFFVYPIDGRFTKVVRVEARKLNMRHGEDAKKCIERDDNRVVITIIVYDLLT